MQFSSTQLKTLTKQIAEKLLRTRKEDSNKGDHGYALLICGSQGLMGSAVISARACLRTGCGLLTVNIPKDERFIIQSTIPEAMVQFRENVIIDLSNYSAIGIGPGIGKSEESQKLVSTILYKYKNPILLDADALNIVSDNKKLFKNIPYETILTPHPKEFDRLFGNHNSHEERINTAVAKAIELNCIIILKDFRTIITYSGKLYVNKIGNSGLAKGGSGDALTGVITSFLAQGYPASDAAKLGVFLHAQAADLTLKKQSIESMLITDVIENLGIAFKEIY